MQINNFFTAISNPLDQIPITRIQSENSLFVCPNCNLGDPKITTRESLLAHVRICVEATPGILNNTTSKIALNDAKDLFDGEGQGLNVCAFCGKPTVKSALSKHLLVCKKRKESQQRRFLGQPVNTNTRPLPK